MTWITLQIRSVPNFNRASDNECKVLDYKREQSKCSLKLRNMNSRRNKFEESWWDIFSRNTVFAYALEFNTAGFDIFDTFQPTLYGRKRKYKKLDSNASIKVKSKEYNEVCILCKFALKFLEIKSMKFRRMEIK